MTVTRAQILERLNGYFPRPGDAVPAASHHTSIPRETWTLLQEFLMGMADVPEVDRSELVERLEALIRDGHEKITELRGLNNTLSDQHEKQKREITALRTSYDTVSNQNAEQKRTIEALKETNDRSDVYIATNENQIAELHGRIKKIKRKRETNEENGPPKNLSCTLRNDSIEVGDIIRILEGWDIDVIERMLGAVNGYFGPMLARWKED